MDTAPKERDGSREGVRPERQVVWLILLRVVIVTTLMLSALLIQAITGTIFSELNPIYNLVALTYFLTLVYAWLHYVRFLASWFVQTQLVGDVLIITGLIYHSGGLDSAFPFLYILPIITASILVERRGALWIALVSCVLYGALIALIYNGVLRSPTGFLATPSTLTMNQVYYNLFVRWIGFLAVAMLSAYLAEKLREAGRSLEERSADLAKLQVYYEDIINSVDSGLLSTDLDGRLVSSNHASERILERNASEAIGRSVDEVLSLNSESAVELSSVGAEGLRFETGYRSASGVDKHLEVVVSRLYDRMNLHRGYTLILRDSTLLRELERELRFHERMAAVGGMAAGIAHEIRNPLASVSGAIQLLRADLNLEDEQRTLMDIVIGESGRLNRIIEDFLFYAKPNPPIPQRVDLVRLVEETMTLFRNSRELGDGYGIALTVEAGEESTLNVAGDPDQLRQVFWNLLRNAVQAMPDGGRLWVRLERSGDGVGVEVDDEGGGFESDQLEQLWEPFHTSHPKGVGLGLAIVYRIVREHGGRVALSNREPQGARVWLWLSREWVGREIEGSVVRSQASLEPV